MQVPEPKHSRIGRLDGVRALAVGLVFLTHAGIYPSGWTGVSLFFVLSGLLITGILRRDREAASFWKPFYIKRATRILPPLVIAFACAALLYPIAWRYIWPYYVFFAANIGEVFFLGKTGNLGVMWSLAVEEQFYFLWPFAIRFLNRRQLVRLLVSLIVLEPVLRAIVTPRFDSIWPIYFLTPFQLDGLALGSLLALLLEDEATTVLLRRWSGLATVLAVVLWGGVEVLFSFGSRPNTVAFNSAGYTLVYVTAACFVCYVLLQENSIVSKVLSWPIAVFVGSISYGFYLFHEVLLDMTSTLVTGAGLGHFTKVFAVLPLVVTAMVSWLSFKFYEQPIIQWGRRKAVQSIRRVDGAAPLDLSYEKADAKGSVHS